MTDPTPTRAEVERPNKAWHDLVTALRGENQALRERAEAAEADAEFLKNNRNQWQDAATMARRERDAARRAEAAAWNDAARICDGLAIGYTRQRSAVCALTEAARDIRALRRAAPTEDQK